MRTFGEKVDGWYESGPAWQKVSASVLFVALVLWYILTD